MRILALLLNSPIIAFLALLTAIFWMVRDEKDKVRPLLVIALTLNLVFGALITIGMARENSLFPMKYDFILFGLDKALGISAASVALHLRGSLKLSLEVVYQLMVPMMVVWILVTGYRTIRGSVVLAYVAELVIGPMVYAIVPACGPAYAFQAKWLHPPDVQPHTIHLAGMPNAFPSLHLATALVLVLFARGGAWRTIALIFLAGTAMATLSTGEHYAIDLVAGLAFGCFAAAVGCLKFKRALAYLGVVLLWSLMVRFEYRILIAHPELLQGLAILTILLAMATVFDQWRTRAPADVPESDQNLTAVQ